MRNNLYYFGLVTIEVVVIFVGVLTVLTQEQEWDTYTNDKFKFSIDHHTSNIDTNFHTEAGDILYLTLGMNYSTDEEYMGISISVFSTNMSSLTEMVDKAAKLAKSTKESIDFYTNTSNKYTNENLV